MNKYDPVTLGILWDKLLSIADDTYKTFCRTSFTPLVREALDAVSVIFDEQGRLLAQANFGPPSFLGTLPQTLQIFLKKFPKDTWNPGDIIATNDPWLGTGHLNDLSMVRPVFHKDDLVAFTGTVNHLPDIGGGISSAAAREVYEEGLRIPPIKIVEKGELNEELFEFILYNVRIVDSVIGDIKSAITTNMVGADLLIEFLDEYSVEDFGSLSEAIISRSEEVMREKIREVPNGIYNYEFYIEGIKDPIKIACSLEVRDDEITVDFDGTDKAVDIGINVPMIYTNAYTKYGVKCVISPTLPNNDGSFKPVEILAPEGSILNAQPPAPVAARQITGHYTPIAVFWALSKVIPEKVLAGTGLFNSVQFASEGDGRGYSLPLFMGGGLGARSNYDGVNTLSFPTNVSSISYEVFEDFCLNSLLFEKRELIIDSAGPGKYRGGLGQEIVVRNLSSKPTQVAFKMRNTEFQAEGLYGGMAGAEAACFINEQEVHPKKRYIVESGGTVKVRMGGGGGFYDPHTRDIQTVVEDVKNEYVSLEAAKKYYGVEVDLSTWKGRRTAE